MKNFFLFSLLGLAACQSNHNSNFKKTDCDQEAVFRSIEAELKTTMPDSSAIKNNYDVVIKEDEHYWIHTYKMPSDRIGGVPITTIDKSTCKIIKWAHSQ